MVRRPKPARSARARPTAVSRTRSTTKRRTAAPASSRSRIGERRTDLDNLSKVSLLELAKSFALRGRHRLSKVDLIRALRELMPPPAPSSGESITARPSPPETSPPTDVVPDGLPSRYGVTEVVALPVDPIMVYLYWELTPDAVAAARRALGPAWEGAVLVLRTYDVAHIEFDGTNAHHQFDTEVWGDVGAWYLRLWRPEQTLLFEVGWRGRDGRFVAAARSNLVQTPRNAPCAGGEERWMTINDERLVATPPDDIPTGSVPDQVAPGMARHELPWSATSPGTGLANRRFRR